MGRGLGDGVRGIWDGLFRSGDHKEKWERKSILLYSQQKPFLIHFFRKIDNGGGGGVVVL